MPAKLVAEEGFIKDLELNFEGSGEWTVGRDPEQSKLVIEDPSVSRKHISLKTTTDGISIENLSDTNPIYINDEEISEPRVLHNGDSVKIGDTYYRYYVSDGIKEDSFELEEEESTEAEYTELEEEEESTEAEYTEPEEEEEEEHRDTIFDENEEGPETDEMGLLANIDLDLSDSAPWLLKVVSGPNNGAQFSMNPDTSYVIGTDPATCDIIFHDVSVSRQHARLSINEDNVLSIEDLGSSNGTMLESKKIEGKQSFSPNTLITIGTTSFIVYNREGERSTIISPLLPSIVKILQKQDEEKAKQDEKAKEEILAAEKSEKEERELNNEKEKKLSKQSTFVSLFIATLVVIGLATVFLFWVEEVTPPEMNSSKILEETLATFPQVEYTYYEPTGRILLVGHVLTSVQKDRLLYELRSYPFVKNIDDNITIDERISGETNQVLARNPTWRGVTMTSPSAGKFLITGYIKARNDADDLIEYLGREFQYIDILDKRIFVEEDILNRVNVFLKDEGFNAVDSSVRGGEVLLSGDIPFGDRPILNELIGEIKQIKGVRDVKSFVTEQSPVETMVNLTSDYTITGSLQKPNGEISVIVQGKILSVGDSLDGRLITKIDSNVIFLESGGIKYRIDYNR